MKAILMINSCNPRNAGDANLLGVEVGYQRDFGFIAPTLKCVGFYGTYTYTHSKVNNFNFTGRENEKDLKLPGSPEHTANASLYFEKGGLNVRLSYNFASDFIDEMGESAFYDRYYDKINYMDVNASYTFGKKLRTTFYAEANNLLKPTSALLPGNIRTHHAIRTLWRKGKCRSQNQFLNLYKKTQNKYLLIINKKQFIK